MFSLGKFHFRTGRTGTPLSAPLMTLENNKVVFRRGGTSLLAGQPGSFKSVMALNFLVSWIKQGHTCVYFSADSDENTVARRVAGILSGRTMDEIETHFRTQDYDFLLPLLDAVKTARFEYRTMDVDGIADRLMAYETAHGDFPDVVFVDNLINFAPSSNDWGAMIDFQNELDALARETKSHIMVLHHVTDGFPFGVPVPRSAIQGKVTQIPRLVLTVCAVQENLMVAVVKNTNGPQFPDASKWMQLHVEPSLRVEDVDTERMIGR